MKARHSHSIAIHCSMKETVCLCVCEREREISLCVCVRERGRLVIELLLILGCVSVVTSYFNKS